MKKYKNVNYIVKTTTRKNSIGAYVNADYVEIRVPKLIREKTIFEFFDKHYQYILNQLEVQQKFSRNYIEGEKFYIKGQEYNLQITKSNIFKVETTKEKLHVYSDSQMKTAQLIKSYYKNLAQLDIEFLVKKYSKIMDLYPKKVKLNNAKQRWGSCNYTKQYLNFSIRVAMLPLHVQEYIVVHELAHLIQPDHSAKFWEIVAQYCQGYKQAEQYLKDNFMILKSL